jgi:hypothetical protein
VTSEKNCECASRSQHQFKDMSCPAHNGTQPLVLELLQRLTPLQRRVHTSYLHTYKKYYEYTNNPKTRNIQTRQNRHFRPRPHHLERFPLPRLGAAVCLPGCELTCLARRFPGHEGPGNLENLTRTSKECQNCGESFGAIVFNLQVQLSPASGRYRWTITTNVHTYGATLALAKQMI